MSFKNLETKTLKDKKKKSKDEELNKIMWEQDIKDVCSTIQGRRVLWKVLGKCKFLQNVGEEKVMHTERNIGKQNLGHWLFSQILSSDESLVFKMMSESQRGDYNYGEQ